MSGPDEQDVIAPRSGSLSRRGYIVPPGPGEVKSLIKYFVVPKGVLDGVVQDCRVVFHAGANKLNDSVWAPSFVLPSLNSLLRIVDSNTLMNDRDMDEMFLNFGLDPRVWIFVAIDLRPLELFLEECSHRSMTWARNLMGFRSLPYNSVKMNLIAEEILKCNRHGSENAFQYNHVHLNLPGTAK